MYQQVTPIEIYVKKAEKKANNVKTKISLICSQQQYICVCIHTDN